MHLFQKAIQSVNMLIKTTAQKVIISGRGSQRIMHCSFLLKGKEKLLMELLLLSPHHFKNCFANPSQQIVILSGPTQSSGCEHSRVITE